MTMVFLTVQNQSQITEQAALQTQAADALTQVGAGAADADEVDSRLAVLEGQTALIDPIKTALAESLEQVLDSAAENITAAELNAAPAGTLKRSFTVELQTLGGAALLHAWANLEPAIVPAINTAGSATAPTLDNTPFYSGGKMTVFITFITGGGITYMAGEDATVPIDVSGFPVLAGVATVTKTYDVT